MAKSDEFREMQISSGQLAAVILVLLGLCVFIFYLGTRVGMKKAAASSPAAAAKTQAPADPATKFAPSISELAGQIQKPAETTAAPSESKSVPAGKEAAKPTAPSPDKPKAAETKVPVKTEQKPAAVEPKPKTAAAAGIFYIQAGALDTREKGETLARRIEGLGFRAIVLNPLAADKKPVYRVRVGPYETKEDAESARGKLAEALKRKVTDFFLVKG